MGETAGILGETCNGDVAGRREGGGGEGGGEGGSGEGGGGDDGGGGEGGGGEGGGASFHGKRASLERAHSEPQLKGEIRGVISVVTN